MEPVTPNQFKEARCKLGFTQLEMGVALRLTGDQARTVRRWEAGEREISGPVSLAVEYLLAAQTAIDLQEVLDDKHRLTRELDIALNGDGAVPQASLCDIVGQIKDEHWKLVRAGKDEA